MSALAINRAAQSRHPKRRRKTFGRYLERRRPVALPKPFTGYGAYRLVVAGGLAHVIGPAGVRCTELTDWARSLLAPPAAQIALPGARAVAIKRDPFAEARRVNAAMDAVRMLLDAVNWVHPSRPSVVEDLLASKSGPARDVVSYWLGLRGCEIIKGRGRIGKVVLPPSADEQWAIGVTLSRFRQLFDFWSDGHRPGHNPMQMDPGQSRLRDGETRKVKHGETRWWLDIDSLFRTRRIERQAPRPGDQDAARRILARGVEMQWPEEVQLLYTGMYLTGARIGQLSAATVYDLLVAAPDKNKLPLIQKGSRGLLAWSARVPNVYRDKLLDMLGRRTEGGLVRLRRLAKSSNPLDHATLRETYIYSPDGVAPVPSWRLSHLLRLVVEDLGMCFRIGDGSEEPKLRWFTSHWFRHMFVNRMLDRIAESTLEDAARQRAREKLASYMGWKHPEAMLGYYGRYHFDREVDQMVAEHQDDLNDKVSEAFGDDFWLEPANDNGLIARGRAVGSDLLD